MGRTLGVPLGAVYVLGHKPSWMRLLRRPRGSECFGQPEPKTTVMHLLLAVNCNQQAPAPDLSAITDHSAMLVVSWTSWGATHP